LWYITLVRTDRRNTHFIILKYIFNFSILRTINSKIKNNITYNIYIYIYMYIYNFIKIVIRDYLVILNKKLFNYLFY